MSTTYKAAPFISMRKLIKARGREFEETFLEQLLPKERDLYYNALAVTRVIDETALGEKGIFYIAANMLYPKEAYPIRSLGKAVANNEINGVYKIFFRMSTMEFILNRVAKVWRQYNDQGQASIENFKLENKIMTLNFVVKDFPEFSEVRKEYLAGYICALIEYAKGKVIRVVTPQTYTPEEGSKWLIKAQF